MGNFSLSKLHYLLLALLVMAMTGCGTSNTAGTAGSGAIAAKLNWNDSAKTSAKTLGLIPAGVTKVRLTVSGAGIPVVRKEVAVTAGETGSAQLDGIYPGKMTLSVQALAASGTVMYEGAVLNVVVTAGQTTDVGTISMTPPLEKAQDQGCISCHETTTDITGQNLVADFKKSGHYRNGIWTANAKFGITGTGCAGCHGPSHNDLKPAESGRCFECHGALGARHQNAASLVAGDANPARYLTGSNNNCSACHEPHNPIDGVGKQERKDWAESGHGNVNGLAWAHYNFNDPNRGGCSPCHTPDGFVRAIDDGWVSTAGLSSTAGSKGKQPLTCDACHSSNDFKNSVRTLSAGTVNGGYKAAMGGFSATPVATIQFENVGESNICIPCHASRENGDSINASTANFGNTGFKNPHYLAAAAVFYGKGGFQFYTSNARYNRYAANRVGQNAGWSHGKLGMSNFATGATTANAGEIRDTGNKGQCVACHLGPNNVHSFDAFDVMRATWGTNTTNKGCFGCHGGEDMEEVATEEKGNVDRALDFLAYQLEAYGLYFYNDANPYFFTAKYVVGGTNTSATNWTTDPYSVGATGKMTMGAAQNLKLLAAEKGSHVHNRAFMRALINDSVVYLQKGPAGIAADRTIKDANINNLMNFTNYSTAVSAPNADRLAGKSGSSVSVSSLKSYLTRSSSGLYYRR